MSFSETTHAGQETRIVVVETVACPQTVESFPECEGDVFPADPGVTDGLAYDLNMGAQLRDNLALMFEKFGRSELIVCLEGEVTEAGELQLRDFRMPHIAYSRPTGTGVHPDGTCAQYDNVVATLHTHPRTYPEDRGRDWNNCYLSRTDIVTWLERSYYPFTVVMCGPRIWAWWHRSQVEADKVLAFPPTGQIRGKDALKS